MRNQGQALSSLFMDVPVPQHHEVIARAAQTVPTAPVIETRASSTCRRQGSSRASVLRACRHLHSSWSSVRGHTPGWDRGTCPSTSYRRTEACGITPRGARASCGADRGSTCAVTSRGDRGSRAVYSGRNRQGGALRTTSARVRAEDYGYHCATCCYLHRPCFCDQIRGTSIWCHFHSASGQVRGGGTCRHPHCACIPSTCQHLPSPFQRLLPPTRNVRPPVIAIATPAAAPRPVNPPARHVIQRSQTWVGAVIAPVTAYVTVALAVTNTAPVIEYVPYLVSHAKNQQQRPNAVPPSPWCLLRDTSSSDRIRCPSTCCHRQSASSSV